MNRSFLSLSFACLLFSQSTFAQKVVAIMPFLSAQPDNRGYAEQLQSIALQTFNSNTNIRFVDRSKDPLVLKELDNQIREQSMSSKTLVQQGRLSGAQELIVCNLSGIEVKATESLGLTGRETKYIANINFSLQNIDAATGVMISTKDFNGSTRKQSDATKILGKQKGILGTIGKTGNTLMASTKDEAIRKAIMETKKEMGDWISDIYPSSTKIINIETRDKKGYAEKVWINASGGDITVGKNILVEEVSMIDDGNGGKLTMKTKVAELKVIELRGQVAVCKVKTGGDKLEEKMKSNLKFTID